MQFLFRRTIPFIIGILFVIPFVSCDEDVTTIGNGVIDGDPFVSSKAVYDVFAFNKKIEAVQTNKLPIYQIGVFNDPIFGKTTASITSQVTLPGGTGNPIFGTYSQLTENNADSDENESTIAENETVTEVFLYIPYLRNNSADSDLDGVVDEFDVDPSDSNSDSDGDGLTDNEERLAGSDPLNEDTDGDGILDAEDDSTLANRFPVKRDLDSIYGNREVPFTLKVERSTFFLRDLDPNTSFLEAQEYYSNQEFSPSFVSDVLFEGPVQISNEQTLIFTEDDPDTEEDESLEAPQIIEPGIRVPLDAAFFQENILNKEGKFELISNSNFKEFFRGIHMSITPITDDIMLLLDLRNARISIAYEYDRVADGEIEKADREFTLNLLSGQANTPIQGNAVNTLLSEAYPPEVSDKLDTGANADKIYLKGAAGSFTEINLFDANNGEELINEIKSKNWIINEANLVFYVDRETMDAAGPSPEPPRLYLYNIENRNPLYNIATENSIADNPFGVYLDYDGFLEESNGQGIKYTVRITDHINNIIIRDSINATLGLTITPDLRIFGTLKAMLSGSLEQNLPVAANITPLSTIIYGSSATVPEDKKLKLEIFYTESN